MRKIIYISILSILTIVSCNDFEEVVDFTEVVNPNLSEDAVVGKDNSAAILLAGIERQAANAINEILVLSELGSDNYENTQTFFNQFMDNLDIRNTDPDVRDTQFAIARLRELAKFGLDQVGPNDAKYDDTTKAGFEFFEGLSYLYSAMYFSYLPQEEKGATVDSKGNYEKAIELFTKAINTNSKAEHYLARARANYYLGNKTEAVADAEKALTFDGGKTLREIKFDETDGPSNTLEAALYERASFDDLQPLPSLDFLDPKYSFLSADRDPSVYIFKAEEAYLILAEAEASTSLSNTKDYLKDLLTLVNSREVRTIDETTEQRSEAEVDSRPNKSTITVNGKSGLVLDRTDETEVPSVSGTSVTVADIDAVTNEDQALNLIYKMRQEIFIGEGLRFVDMGIKLVISEDEILLNPNINDGDPGTVPVIPSFINSIKEGLDAFDYNKTAGTVTITNDVTQVLVNNKTSNEVLPFN